MDSILTLVIHSIVLFFFFSLLEVFMEKFVQETHSALFRKYSVFFSVVRQFKPCYVYRMLFHFM